MGTKTQFPFQYYHASKLSWGVCTPRESLLAGYFSKLPFSFSTLPDRGVSEVFIRSYGSQDIRRLQ